MTTHEEIRVVSAAIEKADLKALRSVLKSMCESSEECRKQAAQRLLLSVPTGSNKRKSEQSPQEAEDASDNKKAKTVVSRFEKCITCKKVFDITTNRDDSCQTHSAYLEIDDDVFPDDDEIANGHVDPYTDWRREEWPEGFIWQCCDRHIKETPCVIQRHIAGPDGAKSPEGTDEESPIEISSDEE
ncbi:hypothetical protein PFICI_08873 [Pestalotiopsis fici W106-1]|uniref:C2H2-type domain-containing protein n=1 Tax=Pestalotiopsis fici (strain W106-1 / CGMCC3.15140) TaxID=1229662 RepID=W3WYT7_PESFW|nr:uncharacterized protein PFICI_08873 [Pestalotiopsis fici W106-1]ETS79020.1 hypothetical protein PFICI_08873 [Pestalotiopsis fici W106-1]